jgi:hypothetical protein
VIGTLKSIAAIGAAPVTMQNSTPGRPSALSASRYCSRRSGTSTGGTPGDGGV